MKKMFSLALALIMALALCVPAFAEDPAPEEPDYKITITNAVGAQTYKAYKVFDVTYSDSNYAYTINADSEWKTLVEEYETEDGSAVFTLTPSATNSDVLVVTVNEDTDGVSYFALASDAAAFAKYLAQNAAGKTPAVTATAPGSPLEESIVELVLDVDTDGYYFIDSSMGALCALNTADPSVSIVEKNAFPSITKKVQEDSNENWVDVADADFGQTVNFKLTVNTGSQGVKSTDAGDVKVDENLGTGIDKDYTIADTLPVGLSLNETAKGGYVTVTTLDLTTKHPDDVYTWVKGTDYTETFNEAGRLLGIALKSTGKLGTLAQNTDITITYSAMVNDQATVAGAGNENSVCLEYNGKFLWDDAKVETWDASFFKFTYVENDSQLALADATFTLQRADETELINLVATETANTYNVCATAKCDAHTHVTSITTDSTGKFHIDGLDSDEYLLTETVAPDGYNLLTAPVAFRVTDKGVVEVASEDDEGNTVYKTVGVNGVEIENKTGLELPSTGGIGTTIFYTVGGLMMAAAVVLFVTKKKLAVQE